MESFVITWKFEFSVSSSGWHTIGLKQIELYYRFDILILC